jgi:hypothetical protein
MEASEARARTSINEAIQAGRKLIEVQKSWSSPKTPTCQTAPDKVPV